MPGPLTLVAVLLVAIATVVPGLAAHAAEHQITSLAELNDYLAEGKNANAKVGFLTEGNFESVANELHANVEAMIYATSLELHDAVQDGTVIAGLVSGTPLESHDFNVFGSEQISARSMFVKPGNTVLEQALDAGLVRLIASGGVEQCAAENPPYQGLVVHSCNPDTEVFDWPTIGELGNPSNISIGALGPWNWGGADGDYTVDPYTGFWPCYYNLLEQEFEDEYGIGFERIWYSTANGMMDALLAGDVDTSEPYMHIGAAYTDPDENSFSRKSVLDSSCITSATQDKYFTKKPTPQIKSLTGLNAYLGMGGASTNTKIGFLTQGNFHSVENELHGNVEAMIFETSLELHDAVQDGTVIAGLVSGTPLESHDFNVFGSEQISARSMLIKSGNTAMEQALDAALVRLIANGGVEKCAAENPPYQALVVHSCKPDKEVFDWPTLAELGDPTVVKIGALGPWNWGGADGDYTVEPHTGFWPCYYNLIEQEFEDQYGIGFDRVWYSTSNGMMDALLAGDVDTSEPYMMVNGKYTNSDGSVSSRNKAFDLSCITSATQDKYFTKPAEPLDAAEDNSDSHTGLIVLVVVGGFFLVMAVAGIAIMCHYERQGKPLFTDKLLGGKADIKPTP